MLHLFTADFFLMPQARHGVLKNVSDKKVKGRNKTDKITSKSVIPRSYTHAYRQRQRGGTHLLELSNIQQALDTVLPTILPPRTIFSCDKMVRDSGGATKLLNMSDNFVAVSQFYRKQYTY